MDAGDPYLKLNQINTLWTEVCRANNDPGEPGQAARRALLERYAGAIHRYLLGALRDSAAADELAQEFAFRFLHGDLRGVDRQRGRFRDFVKGVLFHMVADHHHKRRRQPVQMPVDAPEPGGDCGVAAEREKEFLTSWRNELLARTWQMLAAQEAESGQPYHTVLRFRAEHPDLSSGDSATQLSVTMGKAMTGPGFRKTLERARDRFADLLLDEIGEAIADPSRQALEDELCDLELFEQCKEALDRRFSK